MFLGVTLRSQSGQCACRVVPGSGWAAGVCAWQSAADQRCSDAPRGMWWKGLAGSGTSKAQTEARLRPEGRTGARSQLREGSLCVRIPTALSARLPSPIRASHLDLPYSNLI